MAHEVELIVPGLFNLPLEELDTEVIKTEMPGLNHILRYASALDNKQFDLDSIIADCIGLPLSRCLPYAQAFVSPEHAQKHRLVLCRAVHLKADMYNAIVMPIGDSDDDHNHIVHIINDLQELFKEDCSITKLSDDLWLMQLTQCDPLAHYPHYLSVVGKIANQYIEQSKQALPWYRLNNEMQMFMHQHRINQKRIEAGQLPINSLWFWGAGELGDTVTPAVSWYTDDELLQQFAQRLGHPQRGIDDLATNIIDSDALVCDLSLLETLKSPRESNLMLVLKGLESRLFQPLVSAVRQRRCRLRLRAGNQHDFSLTSFSGLKVWNRSKTLFDFSQS